ncbi:ABC transporter permease [bacterium]|nr:ABC transporter permease [bacterium]
MKLRYIIGVSWRNLMSRKIRSIITISGVIIGITTIVFLTSLGYGIEKLTTGQIASQDALYVFDTIIDESDIMLVDDKSLSEIRSIDNVDTAEPGVKMAGKLSTGLIKTDVIIKGYSEKYLSMSQINIVKGEKFTAADSHKALISTASLKLMNISRDTFNQNQFFIEANSDQIISPTLKDNEIKELGKYSIAGVVDDDDSAFIIVPFEEVKKEMSITGFNELKVKVEDVTKISETRASVEKYSYPTDYLGDTIKQINGIFVIFRYIIGGFGIIAMLVAILGMFNTLTVSLLERTREIGVLKANNSSKKDIFLIFLSEALLISSIGSFLGIGSGIFLGKIANFWFNFYATRNGSQALDLFYLPIVFVYQVVIVVLLVGFFTGLYPARRATKIKILDALKYE